MKHTEIHTKYMTKFILFNKIIWIVLALIFFYLTYDNYKAEHPTKEIIILEEIDYLAGTLFHIGIGVLLVYLFNHLTEKKVCIEGEVKLNLYSFGIITIIIALYKYLSRIYHKYYKKDYEYNEE